MPTRTLRLTRLLHIAALSATAASVLAATAAHAQTYVLTTLATFTGTANGANPQAGLKLYGGNLYGTTYQGGASNSGTVFEIAAGTNTLTTLVTFNGTNGAIPEAGLTLDGNGNLYGTTEAGGASSGGTVFEIAAGTNTLTTLATFNRTNGTFPNGANPYGGVTFDGSGNLYGTTLDGGANSGGTVFEIAAGTNMLTTLAAFPNGAATHGGLTLYGGNLYGTTSAGGTSNDGTVFEIAAGTSTITTLVSFDGTNGLDPYAGLTLDSGGNLYGTTLDGGASGDGTVFKIATRTNTLTTLATFNGANGESPYAGLTLDGSGNLYGTTYDGGTTGDGTVFEILSATNALTTLATFNGTNGQYPFAGVTLDGSGNLYGTTNYGGASNDGTVFKLTLTSAATAPEPSALLLLAPSALGLLAVALRPARRTGNANVLPPE